VARGRERRKGRKSGSVNSAPDAETYRARARRAIRQPAKSIAADPLYVGPARRHDKKAMRMVQAASAGVNIMQSGPAFYHPDFEPSSILLPQDQLEKNAWARHFYKHDPIVATAIDLHAELPLSKIKLAFPKGRDKEKNRRILEYFVRMIGNQGCDLFDKLLQGAVEYNKLGNVFLWVQLSDDNRWCESITLLDPDYVTAEKLEWVSRMTAELVPNQNVKSIVENGPDHPRTGPLFRALPPDIRDTIASGRNVTLNCDPRRGSHLAHLARKMSDYDKWGVSLVERCFKNLVYKDRLRQAQDAIAARHMTPKHLIYAEGGGTVDIDQLREQVDAAMNDPDYAIISNYQIVWELIGSSQSFLNVEGEWNYVNDEILIGLQMSKAFLQGEATYAGGQTMLAIMEQRYAMFRTVIEEFVYHSIFIPVCEACGFYETDRDESGAEVKNYLYPLIQWNRLNLTDDTPHKQMLAQMVTEGKLDVGTWLETFGLDPDVVMERIEKEQYTPFDPNFQALQQALYASIAEQIAPAMAKKRALEMGIEIDAGGDEEGVPKFGSLSGAHLAEDGRLIVDTDADPISEVRMARNLASALTSDAVEQMKRESGRRRAETEEERRVERRNKKLRRHTEDVKKDFEVKEPPKRKPPRKDMIRKKKFKELGNGVKPLVGASGESLLEEAAGMSEQADDFAVSLASVAGSQFANAAARFEESALRSGPAVCNVFCPQLVALAATAPGTPVEERIREVETSHGDEIARLTDRVSRRLARASRIEDPTVRERAKRRAVQAAALGVVKAYGKLREDEED